MNQYDKSNYLIKSNEQISILYAKNFPYKIYVENINAPRWPIVLFEVIMLLLMLFLFLSSIKTPLSLVLAQRTKEANKSQA